MENVYVVHTANVVIALFPTKEEAQEFVTENEEADAKWRRTTVYYITPVDSFDRQRFFAYASRALCPGNGLVCRPSYVAMISKALSLLSI